ncbi:MAG TPA: class I SAM-dependent methyltransferase [Thermoplasmata archaeon]|nr:class I SAM-dependent methyltransferase [Thermoplasmata archaeon]
MARGPTNRSAPRTPRVVRGFDRQADAYERGRPGYPAAAVRHLGRVLHLGSSCTVVDLGSGTGKFTRALAQLGAARLAVEPTRGMRGVFERVVPDVPVLDGTAEKIPLPDGFADAIVCAQAFHWFRVRPALREFARVLRAGGGIGLVWNTRDDRVAWSRRITQITNRYHRKEGTNRRWRSVTAGFEDPTSPFGPLHRRDFPNAQVAPVDTFVDRVLSVSSVAVQSPAERQRVAREVREILRSDPLTRGRRVVRLPMTTEVYWSYVR